MSAILWTIDYLKFVRIGDYVQYNDDKFGYVIEIIDDTNIRIREATVLWRTTMDKVKSNTIRLVPLACSKPSVDQNIR